MQISWSTDTALTECLQCTSNCADWRGHREEGSPRRQRAYILVDGSRQRTHKPANRYFPVLKSAMRDAQQVMCQSGGTIQEERPSDRSLGDQGMLLQGGHMRWDLSGQGGNATFGPRAPQSTGWTGAPSPQSRCVMTSKRPRSAHSCLSAMPSQCQPLVLQALEPHSHSTHILSYPGLLLPCFLSGEKIPLQATE